MSPNSIPPVMTIRKSTPDDLDVLMSLFEQGKRIMHASGNRRQWTGGYPSSALVLRDIEAGHSYLCLDSRGEAAGTFAFIPGPDPTYARIYEGHWPDEQPYVVIHRLAGREGGHGVAAACLEWCKRQASCLRADTHRDNLILQHILRKHGFRYCGIIYLANGDERLAYQWMGEGR